MRTLARLPIACVLATLASACAAPRGAPPPASVRTVAVLPPSNRTGDGLLVAGASLLERYALRTERVTVPDVLAAEARLQLVRRGIDVVPPDSVDTATAGRVPGSPAVAAEIARGGGLDGAVLYLEIRRWLPDAGTHPNYVIVALDVALVDTKTNAVVWHAERAARPVATPGAVTLGSAYVDAAHAVMEELFASWR